MENAVFGRGPWRSDEIVVAAAAVLFTVLLLSWIARFTAIRRSRSHHLPPGPKGWPLIGALPYLGKFPHRSLFDLSKNYGPLMYMHLGSLSALIVSNGEMAREVLQTNDQLFASRPPFLNPALVSYGRRDVAWAPYGSYWRQVRKIANSELLTSSKLAQFMDILKDEILSTIHTVLEQSQSGGKDGVNASVVFNGMTMNVITQMMWNRRHRNKSGARSSNDKKFEEIISSIMVLAGANNVADFLPSFLKSSAMRLSGTERRAQAAHKALDEFFENIICEKEQALSKESAAAADKDDFVNVLLKLKEQPGHSEGLSRESMKAILMDLITGGTDTSSITLEWILAELLKHPEMMKKAQDELKTVVGEDRLVSEADIPNLKYIDAVVKEALRHHSAGPLSIPHLSMADCKVGGYDVPANTTVLINIFAIHHDAATWENPFEFNPDRFLHADMDYRGRSYEFIPFSSGRRICPGINLASAMLHIGLAQFLHSVTWSLPEGVTPENVDMTEMFGLTVPRAIPLSVIAKPRLAHHIIYPAKSPVA